jgi:hypothetical protein
MLHTAVLMMAVAVLLVCCLQHQPGSDRRAVDAVPDVPWHMRSVLLQATLVALLKDRIMVLLGMTVAHCVMALQHGLCSLQLSSMDNSSMLPSEQAAGSHGESGMWVLRFVGILALICLWFAAIMSPRRRAR